jgi:2-iminobutanoate/2-iminopropanoate deaminase
VTIEVLFIIKDQEVKIMEKKCINVEGLFKAGPYSHAVEAGGMLFLSGTVPVDPKSGQPAGADIKEATARVLDNIRLVLEAAGSSLEKIIKVGVYLTDMGDFGMMNEVYKTYFALNEPVRTCVAVKELPGKFPIEIEVIALK